MRNIRYIGSKSREDAFSKDTGIVWTPNKVDTVLSDEVATKMLGFADVFQDAGDAKGVSGVADTDVPTPGVGGAGVSDGDKGDVVVSGTGTVWTIDANAISNTKLADVPTATIKGRNTAGSGDPQDLTAAQVRTLLNVADGATANSADATLLARANHTGAQTAATISDFNSAARAQTEAELVAGTNVTITPAGSGATRTLTIAAAGGGGATNLSYTAATRVIASDTGTDATLPLVSSGDAGLAPASGGGTTNYLRADGTWAAPAGGTPVTDRLASLVNTDDFIGFRAGIPYLVAASVLADYVGAPPAATAPAAFTAGQWTAAATAVAGEISFNLTALPSDGGSAITSLEYRVGTGAAIAFAGTGTGVRVVTAGLSAGVAVDLQVRAVNAVGAGAWSDIKNRTPLAGGGGGSVTYVGAGTAYSSFSSLTSHTVAVPAGMVAGDMLVLVGGSNGTIASAVTSEGQSLVQRVSQIGSIWSVVLSGTVPTSITVTMATANEFRGQALAYRGVTQVAGTTNVDVIATPRAAIQYNSDAANAAVVVAYFRVTESVTAALFNGTDARDFHLKFSFDDVGVIAGIHDGPTGSNDIDLTWSAADTGGRYITVAFKP